SRQDQRSEKSSQHGSAAAVHADAADNAGCNDIHLTAVLHIRHGRCIYRNLQSAAQTGKKTHDHINKQLDILNVDTGNFRSLSITSYRIDLTACPGPFHKPEEERIAD